MEARPLRPSGGRAYAALRMQQAGGHPSHLPSSELWIELCHLVLDPDAMIQYYLISGTALWGVLDGPSLVGTLASSRRFSASAVTYLWLWGLFVRPHYRGTPASCALMAAALAWCNAQPAGQRVFAALDADNLRVHRFCDRYGCRPTDATTETLGLWFSVGDNLVEFLR